MIYQIIFKRIDIQDIIPCYSIVSQYSIGPYKYSLVAKLDLVAHVKLYELEALARKIPTLYTSFDDDTESDDDDDKKKKRKKRTTKRKQEEEEKKEQTHFFACLDFICLSSPPIDIDGFSNLVYVDIGSDRVYWDAFILENVETGNVSNDIAHSVYNESRSIVS